MNIILYCSVWFFMNIVLFCMVCFFMCWCICNVDAQCPVCGCDPCDCHPQELKL